MPLRWLRRAAPEHITMRRTGWCGVRYAVCSFPTPYPHSLQHNYPYGGRNCNVSAYLDKTKVTQRLKGSLEGVAAVRNAVAPSMLLVLEEVAGSSGGGW